jgi:hypothetical protein
MDHRKDNAPRAPVDPKTRLMKLEEKYRCELLGEDERLQVYEAIVRLRRKLDGRYKDGRRHEAVETEKLGQPEVMRLLTAVLEERVSEPLDEALDSEERQRIQVRERLEGPTH